MYETTRGWDNATNNPQVQLCFSQTYLSFLVAKPTRSYVVNNVLVAVVNGILTVSGAILNVLVLAVFVKSTSLRNNLGYYLIFVLSFSDLAASLLVHPLFVLTCIMELTGNSSCGLTVFTVLTFALFAGISLLTSLLMNIERYIAILHPFYYERMVTKKRLLLAVFSLTLGWVVIIALPFIYVKIQSFAYVLTILLFCLLVLVLYLRIYIVARKPSLILIYQMKTKSRPASAEEVGLESPRGTSKRLMDLKLAKTYVIIIFCYFFCYIPDAVFLTINQSNEDFAKTSHARVMETWVFTLVAATSTFNSIVFFWRNTELRKEAVRIIRTRLLHDKESSPRNNPWNNVHSQTT